MPQTPRAPFSLLLSVARAGKHDPESAPSWRRIRVRSTAIILLAAAIATVPQLLRGNTCGHDFDIHLVSWFDCLNSWRHGILYPQWAPSPNFGAGEPRFVFYPPFTWMLGAALGAFLPWQFVPIALTFLLLAATGLATRKLALSTLPEAPATLAGCAALFSGYALFTAYERSAFGELSAFWIPLLLLFALRDRNPSASLFRRALDGSATPLALTLAGAWLSNAPLGVMASYLLAAIACTASLLHRSWAYLLRAITAAALGIALTAFYLVPAAFQQRWVDIRQAINDPGMRIENSFLFGYAPGQEMALHNIELRRVSTIAILTVALTLICILIAWRRKTLPTNLRSWLPLALIPLAVLALQLPISLPLWNLLPKLRFLQFPWRWLVVLEAPAALFFAAAVWPTTKAGPDSNLRPKIVASALCAAAFLASTAIAALYYFQPCDDEDAVAPMLSVYNSGAGFQGVDEYTALGADNTIVATGLPDACFVTDPDVTLGTATTPDANPDWWVEQKSCDAIYSAAPPATQSNPQHLRFQLQSPHAGYLILRLRTYPAWRITLNGQSAAQPIPRDDGLIEIPVPQGPLTIAIDWTTTPDVRAGRWLTLLALILLTALCLFERRASPRKSAHLS